MEVKLITSNGRYEYLAQSVLLAGDEGLIEILAHHSDLLLKLDVSLIKLTVEDGKSLLYFVNGGLVQVKDGKVEISSPLLVLIEDKAAALEYYDLFKEKSTQMKQMTDKAVSSRNFYESENDQEFYLFKEERLARFEIFNELIKGK